MQGERWKESEAQVLGLNGETRNAKSGHRNTGSSPSIQRLSDGAYRLSSAVLVERSIEPVFEFFSKADNLDAITPPWLNFRIKTPLPIQISEGTEIEYSLRLRGIPVKWRSRIEDWKPNERFTDVQVAGPYHYWSHIHRFSPISSDSTLVEDQVDYRVPGGRLIHALFVKKDLVRIFQFRHTKVLEILGSPAGSSA